MQGCDNFCTYCVVPVRPGPGGQPGARGHHRRGCRFSGRRGQRGDPVGPERQFLRPGAAAARHLSRAAPAPRPGCPACSGCALPLRTPGTSPDDLIAAFGELPALCEHLHLPVQSGSNRILQAMNRGYTREAYLQKVARLAAGLPRHRHLHRFDRRLSRRDGGGFCPDPGPDAGSRL